MGAPADTKDLAVGSPIAVVTEDQEVATQVNGMDLSFLLAAGSSSGTVATNPAQDSAGSKEEAPQTSGSDVLISPAAGFLLRSYGLLPGQVQATRQLPSGRKVVTKEDALTAVKGKELVGIPAPAVAASASSATPAAPTPSASSVAVHSAPDVSLDTGAGGAFQDVDLT